MAHWQWHEEGWLYKLGFVDFAGPNVVHFLGGVSAFVACKLVGPRLSVQRTRTYSIMEDPEEREAKLLMQQLDKDITPVHVLFGSFMLCIGWLSFNCGSMTSLAGNQINVGMIAMNTLLGAAAGSVTTSALSAYRFNGQTHIDYICNGMLGGLVAVTANCDGVDTWAAVVIGAITPVFLELGDAINQYFKIDDVIGAVPVHGACGVWGILATGLFHLEYGLLYTGKFRFLGVQILGLIATFAWSASLTFLWIVAMNRWLRPIRVSEELEESGADGPEHGIVNVVTMPHIADGLGVKFAEEVESLKRLRTLLHPV